MKRILVVAAHPDDEVLGCGGTIAKHISKKDKVFVIFMANGVGSRNLVSKKDLKDRMTSSKLAKNILGITSCYHLNFPDNKMDSIPLLKIVQKLELMIKKINPEIIYTHHAGDLNIDHKITNAAVMTACRPLPNSSIKQIYGFEILSSTEWATPLESSFKPTFFNDFSKFKKKKIEAIKAYNSEMRNEPHSRSIKHVEILAQHRGYSIGVELAEAFEVYRIIN